MAVAPTRRRAGSTAIPCSRPTSCCCHSTCPVAGSSASRYSDMRISAITYNVLSIATGGPRKNAPASVPARASAVELPRKFALSRQVVCGELVCRGGDSRPIRPKPGWNCHANRVFVARRRHAANDENPAAVAGKRGGQRIIPHALFERLALGRPLFVIGARGKVGGSIVGIQFLLVARFPNSFARSANRRRRHFPASASQRHRRRQSAGAGNCDDAALNEIVRPAGKKGFDRRLIDDAGFPTRPQVWFAAG